MLQIRAFLDLNWRACVQLGLQFVAELLVSRHRAGETHMFKVCSFPPIFTMSREYRLGDICPRSGANQA